MERKRVLVVDDSRLSRDIIRTILDTDSEIEVVGEATNGIEAVDMVMKLKPSIVTMDIEMPVMNGIEAIEKIMATCAVPILVVTTHGDAKTAYAAISKGALDLVVKPDITPDAAQEFIKKVKMLSNIRVITHIAGKNLPKLGEPVEKALSPVFKVASADNVVAIASSTGGPDALSIILSGLPEKFPCPIVIAQHISDGFISGMVEWMKTITRVKVNVAVEGETISPGAVYISPSERHMMIDRSKRIAFVQRQPSDIYRPSCDLLLSSVADVFGPKAVGVILTGMGSDGALGMKKIKDAGGKTIAQDEKTSVVFGMPKVAIDNGCIDKVLPISEICGELVKAMSGGKRINEAR